MELISIKVPVVVPPSVEDPPSADETLLLSAPAVKTAPFVARLVVAAPPVVAAPVVPVKKVRPWIADKALKRSDAVAAACQLEVVLTACASRSRDYTCMSCKCSPPGALGDYMTCTCAVMYCKLQLLPSPSLTSSVQ